MPYLLAFLFLSQDSAPEVSFSTIIEGVERLFARMNDYSSDFVQISEDGLNRRHRAAGRLYLKRSRMARWEYTIPEDQLLVSDGKTVYFYVPADKQVNKQAVGATFDDRLPLMFLLGRSNLSEEFTEFVLLSTKPSGTRVVRMHPRRKTDLRELIMEVDPQTFHIHRLVLAHNDGQRSEFDFTNIRTNIGLPASLFDFKVPSGVQIVEGIGQ